MPFYAADYIADTLHLSATENGAYLLLILHYWMHGGLPTDNLTLARIARLQPADWAVVRETMAAFFEDGWRHKRIDAELAATTERYQRRAEAGRQGGVASGQARQQGSNAAPMLRREGSNAEARLNQPQPHPQSQKKESQSGAGAPPDGSDEDLFYSRLTALEPKGIAKSRAMQLVKLVGDFGEVNRILDSAEAAKKPCQYLGKVIANRQTELNGTGGRCRPSPTMSIPGEPIWVQQRRSTGVHVERDGQRWRCQGEILNDAGEVVGF